MAEKNTGNATADAAAVTNNEEFLAMLSDIQKNQEALEKRVKTAETTNAKLAEQISQKDAVIDGLKGQMDKMSVDTGTTEERKRKEALALRHERAQRLSKGSGAMIAAHAIEQNVEVGKAKK